MPIGIDHIVIAVRDLDETSRDYTSAGFTVVPGGEHHNGTSHNALVAFQDGTYFELIAFKDPRDPDTGPWAAALRETGEGIVTFALRTNDLDAEIEQLTAAGLTVVGPTPGGRVRPDGQRIDWRTIRFSEPSLPFYCHDETARPLRVPDGEQAIHANGVTGVASIAVPVSRFEQFSDLYRGLTGTDGNDIASGRRFGVGNQAIDLVEGSGERPLEVVLIAAAGDGDVLPQNLTHGARLVISS
jgi:catechol 2,3-dioxygenase-like lactoylglutathione lyase family enzyme